MARAGLFIGVDRTGQLDPLSDAAAGAARMYDWFCGAQQVPTSHARLITDAGGAAVTPDDIYAASDALLALPDVDQLLVYFAGHGIYTNGSEQWLLTYAPKRASAAIDLGVSIEHARRLPLSYVAIIADTCRVAPDGVQATAVRGQSLFPNLAQRGRSKPVDVFFASLRGQGAGEMPAPGEAAREYRAIYTASLLQGLSGAVPEVLETISPQDTAMYVMPPLLADYLEVAVPEALIAAHVTHLHDQLPDYVPSGRHSFWLARIPDPPRVTRKPIAPVTARVAPTSVSLPHVLSMIAAGPQRIGGDANVVSQLDRAFGRDGAAGAAEALARPFGQDSHETGCGIKVRGAAIETAFVHDAYVQEPEGARDDIRVGVYDGPRGVALTLSNDASVIAPAVHGYFTALTFDGRQLLEVALDPMPTRSEVAVSPDVIERVRALRGYASTAARFGRLRPRSHTLEQLVDAAMYGDGRMDVTCGLLLAYAAHEANEPDVLARIREAVNATVRARLFDLELLARLHELTPWDDPDVVRAELITPLPLLSRGWVLVDAGLADVDAELTPLRASLLDSPWALYHADATPRLVEAVAILSPQLGEPA